MRIAKVEVVALRAKECPAWNSHEAAIVCLTDDEGHVGVGEGHGQPEAIQAILEAPGFWNFGPSVHDALIGREIIDPRSFWAELYEGTRWSGRVGIGHVALAAVDLALWDLAGKCARVPTWKLLGEPRPDPVTPYVTLYRGAGRLLEVVERVLTLLDEAVALGFHAVKVEPLEETAVDDREIVEYVRQVREHAGPELTLFGDVGYRWQSARQAAAVIRQLEQFDLGFMEAPLPTESLAEYRHLTSMVSMPIAGAEVLTSLSEFLDLMDAGVTILQPGPSRLGITEMDRLARIASSRGAQLIPLGWVPTAIGTAANLAVATVHENVPYVEYAPPALFPEHGLRARAAIPEPIVKNGIFDRPQAPGLGVELDWDALTCWRIG